MDIKRVYEINLGLATKAPERQNRENFQFSGRSRTSVLDVYLKSRFRT